MVQKIPQSPKLLLFSPKTDTVKLKLTGKLRIEYVDPLNLSGQHLFPWFSGRKTPISLKVRDESSHEIDNTINYKVLGFNLDFLLFSAFI